ncbi:MAG: hypothetical protein JWP27_682 [Flaviaesturariibacter sp.]|nr:hypothetical protein [Flaviaesturariibacter sp.]
MVIVNVSIKVLDAKSACCHPERAAREPMRYARCPADAREHRSLTKQLAGAKTLTPHRISPAVIPQGPETHSLSVPGDCGGRMFTNHLLDFQGSTPARLQHRTLIVDDCSFRPLLPGQVSKRDAQCIGSCIVGSTSSQPFRLLAPGSWLLAFGFWLLNFEF